MPQGVQVRLLSRVRMGYKNKEDARSADKARAHSKREALNLYKTEKGCADCGYNEHWAALEFDHIPGQTKVRTVASLVYHSWEKIFEELAKCEVVCANCHAIRTQHRLGLC